MILTNSGKMWVTIIEDHDTKYFREDFGQKKGEGKGTLVCATLGNLSRHTPNSFFPWPGKCFYRHLG